MNKATFEYKKATVTVRWNSPSDEAIRLAAQVIVDKAAGPKENEKSRG